MSKRKKKTGERKRKTDKRRSRKVIEFPVRRVDSSVKQDDGKLSAIIKEMAQRILKEPDAGSSEVATTAALMLASAAWNIAIGYNAVRDQVRRMADQFDWEDITPWVELRSGDSERLVSELVDYKRAHYPNDLRRVVATQLDAEDKVRVHWTEFVFEAYSNHQPEVIFLKGLPDLPGSRPHSPENR